MPTLDEFENRRKERRERERRRKKRIKAALIIILIAGIAVLVCAAVSAVRQSNSERRAYAPENAAADATPEPENSLERAPEPENTESQIPSAAEENNLMQIIADSGEYRRCYLTFDDGPTENITPQILDVLRRYNVKATFFEVGSLIEANPDTARRVYEEGHLIANHSDSHNYDKLYATEESFITEINDCYEKIKGVTNGEEPFRLIRFPGGSYDQGDHAEAKQIYKNTLAENGFYYCDWNTLTGDADGRTRDAEGLVNYLAETMAAGNYNNIIVLMHDASTKQATVDALPAVIEYIAGQGFTFHRLDDIDYQTQSVE